MGYIKVFAQGQLPSGHSSQIYLKTDKLIINQYSLRLQGHRLGYQTFAHRLDTGPLYTSVQHMFQGLLC
jgi:hypothetical protein